MSKTSLFAAMILVGAVGAAEAGGSPGTIGVGAEYLLSGAGGASLNYDAGDFHTGGFLGFFDPGEGAPSVTEIGGRFYYHLHQTTDADFSVGGGLGIVSFEDMAGDRQTGIFVEPGVQIRVFLAANVALSASTGVVLGVSDADGVAVTGGVIGGGVGSLGAIGLSVGGGVGLHYYFF